jgi:IS5 family transposase
LWTALRIRDSLDLNNGSGFAMSRRRIGQENFVFGDHGGRCNSSLDALAAIIDWAPVEGVLSDISSAAKGEPAWPPLTLFKATLLSIWYDLSDVKLAEMLDDRSSFRRFCGFSASEPTPERTAFVRFRNTLVERELDQVLFDAITAQLKAKAIWVKTGTLVDATIIASTSEADDDAHWVKHKGKPAVHGVQGESARIVESKDAGITFEPENAAELRNSLIRLAQDRNLAARLSQNGLAAAREYDRKHLAGRMLEVIRSCLPVDKQYQDKQTRQSLLDDSQSG